MKRILIIEDDQIVANIYRNKLAVEGYQVEVASDGDTGLRLVESFKPELILLDLMLPGLPGLDVLKQIRASEDFKDVPVIVLSNTYLSSMVQSAWKAGATKCLSKANCTPRQLLEVLRGPEENKASQATEPVDVPPPATQTANSAPATAVIAPPTFEAVSQQELKRRLSTTLPILLSALRPMLQSALKLDDSCVRTELMEKMHQQIRELTGAAGVAGYVNVAQMAAALEALLKELRDKPHNINKSSLRTVATALDFISVLLKPGMIEERELPSFGNILVVDDEPMSRRAVAFALEKANLNSIAVASPKIALELLADNKFDLIFLDIDMPEMSGLELCSKLRELPPHKKVPVIFVTSLNDFDNRANSTMSGGNDLIGKPFLFMELAVKALCYVFRSRMEAPKRDLNNRFALMAEMEQDYPVTVYPGQI